MAEETQTPQDDAANFSKVQEFIRTQVSDYIQEMQQQAQRQNPQYVQTEQERARQELDRTLSPFIDPKIHQIQLETANTRDMLTFEKNNPYIEKDDRDKVEAMFEDLKKNGRAIPRQDIFDYLEGKAMRENPEETTKRMSERKQRQLERAQGSVDFGANGLDRMRSVQGVTRETLEKSTSEEIEKLLDGITF